MVLTQVQQMRMQHIANEMEERLERIRLRWFEQNYEKIFLDPFRPSSITPKNAADLYRVISELRKKQFAREIQARREDKEANEEIRRQLIGLQETFQQRFEDEKAIMRPVTPDVRQLLYNGVSNAGEGKYLYLKVRNELAPYEKYYRKITTTQTYGWKIEERAGRPIKTHNRLPVIKGSFYRRFGAIRPESTYRTSPFSSGQVTVDRL